MQLDFNNFNLLGQNFTKEMSLAGVPFSIPAINAAALALDARRGVSEHQRRTTTARVKGLLAAVEADGRVRPTWSWNGTKTGRFGCTDPGLLNLQKELRKCVQYVDCVDVAQFDYIVACGLAGEQWAIDAYRSGQDLYGAMATILRTDRIRAKEFTIANMYGQTDVGVSKRLNIPVEEAQLLIRKWWAAHPALSELKTSLAAYALPRQQVETQFLKHSIEVSPKDDDQDEERFASRAFANYIQGTAADIVKMAFVALWETGTPVFAVYHDELCVPRGTSETVTEALNSVDNRIQLRTTTLTL